MTDFHVLKSSAGKPFVCLCISPRFCCFTFPLLSSFQAVDDMNGKELNGRQVYVGRAQKKGERQNELKRKFEQMKQDRMTRYQVGGPILP